MIRVNGDPLEWRPGMTVRDVLEAMNYRFPLVIVRIDGRLIPRETFATAPVPDDAEVGVMHLMSGG